MAILGEQRESAQHSLMRRLANGSSTWCGLHEYIKGKPGNNSCIALTNLQYCYFPHNDFLCAWYVWATSACTTISTSHTQDSAWARNAALSIILWHRTTPKGIKSTVYRSLVPSPCVGDEKGYTLSGHVQSIPQKPEIVIFFSPIRSKGPGYQG